MSKNKHKFLTFAALMTGATVAVHFINHTIATITVNGALGTFIIPKRELGHRFF